jgi:hypothetical protein
LPFWRWIRKDAAKATAQRNVIRSAGSILVDEVEENTKNSHRSSHSEIETITLHGPTHLFVLEPVRDSHICIVVYERESNYLTSRALVNDIAGLLHDATLLSIRMELFAKIFQGSLTWAINPGT